MPNLLIQALNRAGADIAQWSRSSWSSATGALAAGWARSSWSCHGCDGSSSAVDPTRSSWSRSSWSSAGEDASAEAAAYEAAIDAQEQAAAAEDTLPRRSRSTPRSPVDEAPPPPPPRAEPTATPDAEVVE